MRHEPSRRRPVVVLLLSVGLLLGIGGCDFQEDVEKLEEDLEEHFINYSATVNVMDKFGLPVAGAAVNFNVKARDQRYIIHAVDYDITYNRNTDDFGRCTVDFRLRRLYDRGRQEWLKFDVQIHIEAQKGLLFGSADFTLSPTHKNPNFVVVMV